MLNLFQSNIMVDFWKSLPEFEPVLIQECENGVEVGRILGVILMDSGVKGYLSRRCIVWGGPVIASEVENRVQICDSLLKSFLDEVRGKAIFIEFRNLFDCEQYKQIFEKHGFVFSEHLNFINKLTEASLTKKVISESKLRQIKKSIKAEAEIIVSSDEKEINEYYELLAELYKTKVKTPLPNLDYFLNFSKFGIGVYLLIKFEGKIIGGLMGGIYDGVMYEMYVCGEDGKYKDIYPSVLATYAAIEYGVNNGLKYFDFLGAGKPDEDYGVREFKSKFGGQLVNYGRFKLILNKPLYKIGEFGVKLMKKYG